VQVVTLNEAKALLKVDDDLIIAVYDYWLNKRLRLVCCYVFPVLLFVYTGGSCGLQVVEEFHSTLRSSNRLLSTVPHANLTFS